jgi:hypothetical protein
MHDLSCCIGWDVEPKTGVEPVTSVVPGQRSDQTELRRHRGAGSGGLEPPQRGPKPRGLPLAELPPAKVSSPGVEPGPAGLQPAALPLTPKGPAWRSGESNPGPSVCRTDALPTELQPHETRREPGNRTPRFLAPNQVRSPSRSFPKMPSAVELSMWNHAPAAVLGHCCTQGRQDSNLQPSVLETDAQPVELHPYRENEKPPGPCAGRAVEEAGSLASPPSRDARDRHAVRVGRRDSGRGQRSGKRRQLPGLLGGPVPHRGLL